MSFIILFTLLLFFIYLSLYYVSRALRNNCKHKSFRMIYDPVLDLFILRRVLINHF